MGACPLPSRITDEAGIVPLLYWMWNAIPFDYSPIAILITSAAGRCTHEGAARGIRAVP